MTFLIFFIQERIIIEWLTKVYFIKFSRYNVRRPYLRCRLTGIMSNPSIERGMEQLIARRAHTPKVVGSSPAPATLV
jgi:hypothetical protein